MFDAPNQTAAECFSSIRTIAAFSLGPYVSQLYAKQLAPPTAAIGKTAQASGIGFGFSQAVMFLVSSCAVVLVNEPTGLVCGVTFVFSYCVS